MISERTEMELTERNSAVNLSENQQALVNRLATGKFSLASCSGGYALWRKDIKWSQGRVASNAVSDEDIEALVSAGLLERDDSGWWHPAFSLFKAATRDNLPWIPSDDPRVYRGAPLLP
jgi:hypothetical protein